MSMTMQPKHFRDLDVWLDGFGAWTYERKIIERSFVFDKPHHVEAKF